MSSALFSAPSRWTVVSSIISGDGESVLQEVAVLTTPCQKFKPFERKVQAEESGFFPMAGSLLHAYPTEGVFLQPPALPPVILVSTN